MSMDKSSKKMKLWFDRLLSKSIWRQLSFLALILLIALGISYAFLLLPPCSRAQWIQYCESEGISPFILPLYLLIDSNALNNLYFGGQGHTVKGWALIASSLSFLVGAFIFNGAIIGIITNAIEQRVKKHREGHVHYLKSGHYIIMGYDEMVPSFITHIFEKDKEAFVLLMSAVESEIIREKLMKVFNEEQLRKIIINYGHRMTKDYYKDIHLESAKQIYIVGLRTLTAHDAVNVECVDSICSYLEQSEVKERPKRITCVFEDLDTYAAFKTTEIFGKVKELGIEFVPYNFYTGWAKQVFVKRYHMDMDCPGDKISYPTVFGKGINTEDPKFVHLVFVGTTNFAVAFAMEAANVLHFPNFIRDQSLKTLITFIDVNADKEKDEFITRYRHLFEIQSYKYRDLSKGQQEAISEIRSESLCFEGDDANFLDVEFEFIKGDVFSKSVQDVIRGWAKDTAGQYLSIFLALSNQRQNFAFGMNMPDEVYDNEIPVFIRQDRSDNFVSNLRTADEAIRKNSQKNTHSEVKEGQLVQKVAGGRYANIYPFGMNETAYSADEKSLERAKLINYLYDTAHYDQNKFQSFQELDAISAEEIWSKANASWRKLSVALKWSNLYNAYTIRIKLASLRAMRGLELDDRSKDIVLLSDEEVEMMARIEHNRWIVEKLLMGYRKPRYNEDKYVEENKPFETELSLNKKRFIHHDIRPYDQLDKVKELDKEYSRYIPWIIKMTEK